MRLFVYGTLMSGQPNHRCLPDGSTRVGPATVRGTLYHLGGYPGLRLTGDDAVRGEVWDVPSLDATDLLEGYRPGRPEADNLYTRRTVRAAVEVAGGPAELEVQAYELTRAGWPFADDAVIADGDWAAQVARETAMLADDEPDDAWDEETA